MLRSRLDVDFGPKGLDQNLQATVTEHQRHDVFAHGCLSPVTPLAKRKSAALLNVPLLYESLRTSESGCVGLYREISATRSGDYCKLNADLVLEGRTRRVSVVSRAAEIFPIQQKRKHLYVHLFAKQKSVGR